jgi:two-component system, LytTR family, sensor histidine kinase LytS
MLTLASLMLEKVGLIVMVAFLLSKMHSFRYMIQHDQTLQEKLVLILLFGSFGVISNYTGIEIQHQTITTAEWLSELDSESALANTRVMGIVIGGVLGGPVVGIGAGLFAGLHRFTLGGFTGLACALSTILAGVVAGYLGKKRKQQRKPINSSYVVIIGMCLETVQMLIILLVAKPFGHAWELVQFIGLPMILGNGLGTLIFMFIIQTIQRDFEMTRANQTNLAFLIADQTLPFFRQGLNMESCKGICDIMLKYTDADAVSVTDRDQVLAHVGTASDHHFPLSQPVTGLTKRVLSARKVTVAKTKGEISCFKSDCPLEAAIVLPLKVSGEMVGTLKMYYTQSEKLDQVQQELAEGLANLFSTQLELAEAERQTKLLKDAEIKALQAQIHPHFLFNSLNTISALCRTNPDQARKLLLDLSLFFRGNLQGARQMLIPLEKELENVKAYFFLEQSRFPDKYIMDFDIKPGVEKVLIPPFTLQPLVENAIHYGFLGSKTKGNITIQAYHNKGRLQIMVRDNGKGITIERLQLLGKQIVDSKKGNGTALFNISQRLNGIYNGQASLQIESLIEHGTQINISIPIDEKGVLSDEVESLYSG